MDGADPYGIQAPRHAGFNGSVTAIAYLAAQCDNLTTGPLGNGDLYATDLTNLIPFNLLSL
jgi:hypothetical protein